MTDVPDLLVLKRHRDLEGMGRLGVHVRRLVVALLVVFALLALANVFGQRPKTIRVSTPAVTFSLYAPTAIRGGDFMEARFHVTAKRDVKDARLLLDPGWAEGSSINTIEPAPIGEASDDGRLAFDLGHIAAGKAFILFMQFQINATNVAWHRSQNVELLDGSRSLASIHRTITIFP
jgi:hypothetical protein